MTWNAFEYTGWNEGTGRKKIGGGEEERKRDEEEERKILKMGYKNKGWDNTSMNIYIYINLHECSDDMTSTQTRHQEEWKKLFGHFQICKMI